MPTLLSAVVRLPLSLGAHVAPAFDKLLDLAGLERKRPRVDGDDLASLSLLDALVWIARRAGKEASPAALSAALPTRDGDLDPRLAAMALARVGLDGRWEKRRLRSLAPTDLPALIKLRNGRAVIVTGIDRGDIVTIVEGDNERTLLAEHIEPDATGEVLLIGHVDPENGSLASDEHDKIRASPRMWLLGSFLHERRRMVQLLVTAVLLNLCALAIPLYMRAIYDRVLPNLALESLWALSLGVVLVLSFEFMFKHVRGTFVDAIGLRIGQAIQHRVMTSILHARLDKSKASVGSMMTSLRDVEAMATLVPQAIVTFCVDVPFFFLYVALIAMIGGWAAAGPVAGAVAMIIVGVIAAFALKYSSRRSAKLMQARNNLVVDVVEGLSTIKTNQAEGRFLRQWDLVSDHVAMNGKATREWLDLPAGASALLVQIVTVLIVIIGVFQIKAGMMTTGALIAATMLAGRAMVPVFGAISIISKGYQSMSQFVGLASLLALEPEAEVADPAVQGKRIAGAFELHAVTYAYPEAPTPVLEGLNLTIAPGERIGLVGRAGSGKSTLLQLLAGLIMPGDGRLLVDGRAVEQYAASQLRQGIAYAAQDAMLFDASIRENILLGVERPSEVIVDKALRAAGVDAFVSRTAEGYGRKLGPRGSHLSGGQRQAIVLARALIRDPGVLLLDEPTAAMDINAEQFVIGGLRDFTRGRTLLIATHRFALLDLVDRVIWLEEGRIVADRPRDEVLAMLRRPAQRSAA
jgi:ATP-binding cassette subfamily C protein LapB